MAVIGPQIQCHKCGAKLRITPEGKVPIHNAKWTNNTCIGSLDKAKGCQ